MSNAFLSFRAIREHLTSISSPFLTAPPAFNHLLSSHISSHIFALYNSITCLSSLHSHSSDPAIVFILFFPPPRSRRGP